MGLPFISQVSWSSRLCSSSSSSTSAMSLLYECVNTVIAGEGLATGSRAGGCVTWKALPAPTLGAKVGPHGAESIPSSFAPYLCHPL